MGWYFSLIFASVFCMHDAFAFFDPCFLLFGKSLTISESQQLVRRSFLLEKRINEIKLELADRSYSTQDTELLQKMIEYLDGCKQGLDNDRDNLTKHWVHSFLSSLGEKLLDKSEHPSALERFRNLQDLYVKLFQWSYVFHTPKWMESMKKFNALVHGLPDVVRLTPSEESDDLFKPILYETFREKMLSANRVNRLKFTEFFGALYPNDKKNKALLDVILRKYWFESVTRELLKTGLLSDFMPAKRYFLTPYEKSTLGFRIVMSRWWRNSFNREQTVFSETAARLPPDLEAIATSVTEESKLMSAYLLREDVPWRSWLLILDDLHSKDPAVKMEAVASSRTVFHRIASFANYLEKNGSSEPIFDLMKLILKNDEVDRDVKKIISRLLISAQTNRMKQRLEGIEYRYGQEPFTIRNYSFNLQKDQEGWKVFEREFLPLYEEFSSLTYNYLELFESDENTLSNEMFKLSITQAKLYAIASSIHNTRIHSWTEQESALLKDLFVNPDNGEETDLSLAIAKIWTDPDNKITHLSPGGCAGFVYSHQIRPDLSN